MSIIGNNILAGASGNQGYEIERSLRFNDDDTAYLNRTPASAGNRKTWTWSGWVKRGSLSSFQVLFGGGSASPAYDGLRFTDTNALQFFQQGGTAGANLTTVAVFRDTSAWYHVVLKLNSTASEAAIFVNGIEQSLTGTQPTNADRNINNTIPHAVGAQPVNSSFSNYLNGYLAEVNFIDGQALDATSFGETDTITGAWIPKKYSGSYGTNGFYLNFSDNSGVTATTLGKDSSGNGNNWTPNNFSVTAGAGNDSLEDTPTNNFCTMNALAEGADATLSNGNLDVAYGSANTPRSSTIATMGMSSGKWYWEHKLTSEGGEVFGITNVSDDSSVLFYPGYSNNGWGIYGDNGDTYHNGSAASYGSVFATNDVIGCAFDADNGKIWWSKNGTFFNSGDPAAGTNAAFSSLASDTYFPAVGDGSAAGTYTVSMNFGQRAFDYTPPTGFKALNTANLPVPTVKDGTEYFNTVLYTGTGSSNAITGVGFQPDWVWIKKRSASENHELQDAVRGATKRLASNSTAAESTVSGSISSFDSDGFTVVDAGTTNENTSTYVAWNWKAGGSGSANTDGTISSTVSVNADAGFSIVSWAAEASAGTVGHGLGVAPQMIIMKDRDTSSYPWLIYHQEVGIQKYIAFSTAAPVSASTAFSTAPTSTVFDPGTGVTTGNSYGDLIAYCFAEVEGYSKFGSYTGNGSADGTFIYTGFRPAFVMVKSVTNTSFWQIEDAARGPTNEITNKALFPNSSLAESGAGAGYAVDFLSNGFKWRNTGANYNTSGQTYIFAAVAETPFKYTNAR